MRKSHSQALWSRVQRDGLTPPDLKLSSMRFGQVHVTYRSSKKTGFGYSHCRLQKNDKHAHELLFGIAWSGELSAVRFPPPAAFKMRCTRCHYFHRQRSKNSFSSQLDGIDVQDLAQAESHMKHFQSLTKIKAKVWMRLSKLECLELCRDPVELAQGGGRKMGTKRRKAS